ncbi:MAG TPA: M20/M25/M40 family metallo-hydrolase [Longimicrobiales bacterium]|nr:M20/M25/M40 family metallo-hydrolase [Longimicrobiales bacterium]
MYGQRVLVAGLLLTACAQAPAQQANVQPAGTVSAQDLDAAVQSITPQDFFARIGFLASDALGGRDTPSPGLEAAAAYIASEFHRYGLRPAGDAGSFIQRWPYTTRAMDVAGVRFDVTAGGAARSLTYRSDFYAQPGARGSFDGGLVFVGSAITAASVRGNALRNRAVLLYHAEAPSAQDLARLRAAADSAGAGAIVIALGATADAAAIARAAQAAERPRGVGAVPVFFLRNDRARELFGAAGLDFAALTAAGATPAPTQLTGATATLGAGMIETVHQVPNVVGILEGSDPVLRNTYLIYSAHIDHVGSGCRGTSAADQVCNGADDDASGTSAVLEMAEAFATLPVRPRRSIIFLGVSGEEKGLLGSRHYADNPTVPIESLIANINMDMVGRDPHPDTVSALGQAYSSLGPLVQRLNSEHPELRLTVADDMWPGQNLFFRSDHFHFLRREVPALFFFTGLHDDYHAASDHVENIDLDKITRVTRLVFRLGHAIANDTNAPQWDPAGLEEVRRLTTQGR